MPSVQRKDDPNSAGAPVLRGVSSVRTNGRPTAVVGMPVRGHGRGSHASAQTKGGVSSVRIEGSPVVVDGNPDSCGHVRVNGSPNVRAG